MTWETFNPNEIKTGDTVSLEVADGRGHHVAYEGIVEVNLVNAISIVAADDGMSLLIDSKRIRRMKINN